MALLALTLIGAALLSPLPVRAQGAAPLSVKPIPLLPERNPPGDIPDTQVFVDFHSPLGFSVKVPEGWARRDAPDGVTFTSVYDGVAVQISHTAKAPTLQSVKREQAAALEKSPAAVRIGRVAEVQLPAGRAVLISFASNSEPNSVTGKAIRLESDQYLIWKDGRVATLTLSAPFGADNADQWRLMARSFRWQ